MCVRISILFEKNSPSIIKKSDNFKKFFLPLIFNLLLEVDNENDINKY